MDTETSVMVEALYASGKVERPKHSMSEGLLAWAVNRKEWVWDKAGVIFWPAESSEAEVFTSLVKACWAKGWWCARLDAGDGSDVFLIEDEHDNVPGKPFWTCPIRAMLSALNGGG